MILGVDHLALSVIDADKVKGELETQGFVCSFFEKGIENNVAKKPLLSCYEPRHDLGVLVPQEGGIPIEITNHGSLLASNEGPYSYFPDYVELQIANLVEEKRFWCTVLRFREIDPTVLKLISPVPDWACTLRLRENKGQGTCTLDGQGYTCLALLTNNIKNEIEVARNSGASHITPVFRLSVNQKQMDIAMFRTPGGAICELIQIMSG